jgi:hypothetical protein
VVNADGRLAKSFGFGGQDEQRRRLIADGVYVINYRVDLEEYGIDLNEFKKGRSARP